MNPDLSFQNMQLAEAIDALALDRFYEKFARLIENISGYQISLIIWLECDQRPVPLFADVPDLRASIPTRRWLEEAYLLDPAYSLYANSSEAGVYALSDISPDEFFDTPYYKKYYAVTGQSEEVLLLIRVASSSAVLITLANKNPETHPADAVGNLIDHFPVLSALCQRHQSAAGGEVNFSGPLKKAFGNFGRDHLTERERDVVHLLLKGHSTRSIAELLDLSVNTVKVYAKRFHKKLGVSSQAELFSLFFEAISLCPFDADIDPLTHYLSITQSERAASEKSIPA